METIVGAASHVAAPSIFRATAKSKSQHNTPYCTPGSLSLRCSFVGVPVGAPCNLQRKRRGGEGPKQQSVRAAMGPNDGVRWWEKDGGLNLKDIHSIGDFVELLSSAGEQLVVVEFYASWCGSCRALFPKLCKIAAEHPDIKFAKVNFEENKQLCKGLNIKVLPYFHFYRGADGRLDAFSASISKLTKLREAIAEHNTERCSLGPPAGVGKNFDWDEAAQANAAAAAAAKAAAAASR